MLKQATKVLMPCLLLTSCTILSPKTVQNCHEAEIIEPTPTDSCHHDLLPAATNKITCQRRLIP